MSKILAWVIVLSSLAVAVRTTIPLVHQLGFVSKRYHYSFIEFAPGHPMQIEPWQGELFVFVLTFAVTLTVLGGTSALLEKLRKILKAKREVLP